EVRAKRTLLAETQITSRGTVQEWSQDFFEGEPDHRHLSHLFAFYPGSQYVIEKDRAFTDAAKKTIAYRSSGHKGAGKIGWSIPWVAALYSRLDEPEKAFEFLLRYHSTKVLTKNLLSRGGSALEQCFGFTAAVAEMLMQSHNNEIKLLPALPKLWPDGEISGIVARGGFEISLQWENNVLKEAQIKARKDSSCKVSYKGSTVVLSLKTDQKIQLLWDKGTLKVK
ncbi:MAG: hypothetical protein HRT88_20640, partial [Lentisphaeraceae bacterium]|nr:hypothetical protein [Lentisphaeraceae bacterium]